MNTTIAVLPSDSGKFVTKSVVICYHALSRSGNSALGKLKYFVSIGYACCASRTDLISALSTPVDDVATKKNLNLLHLGLQLIVLHHVVGCCLVPRIEVELGVCALKVCL